MYIASNVCSFPFTTDVDWKKVFGVTNLFRCRSVDLESILIVMRAI